MKKLKAKLNAKKRKGFTIVELIVVMAIIAILTLIAVPTFTKFIDDAEETTTDANARTLHELAMTEMVSTVTDPTNYTSFDDINTEIENGANMNNVEIVTDSYKDGETPTSTAATSGTWKIYLPTTNDGGLPVVADINTSGDIYIISPTEEGSKVYLNGEEQPATSSSSN